jgi:hypothetical protein
LAVPISFLSFSVNDFCIKIISIYLKRGGCPRPKSGYQDVPAWLALILAGRPWLAPRRPPRITSRDSFGGQYRYEPSPNILNVFPTISCFL